MEKLYAGPVPEWKPDTESQSAIEEMLASEDELIKAFGEAYRNGCWIREFGGMDGSVETGMTAVGDFNTIAELEFRHGVELDQNEFGLGACIELALPGSGTTRVARVRDGVRQVLEARIAEQRADVH